MSSNMSDSEVVKVKMRPLVLHCKSIKGEKLDVCGTSKPTETGPDGWNSNRFGLGVRPVVHIQVDRLGRFFFAKKKNKTAQGGPPTNC